MNFFNQDLSLRKIAVAVLGNLAMTFWFMPWFAKLLHKFRGVNFVDCNDVFIGRNVLIDNSFPELIFIGKDVWLTANTVVLAHSSISRLQKTTCQLDEMSGPVVISDGVFIGSGSIICPSVTIGKGAYIAAGSVVTSNVEPFSMVAGVPAKFVKSLV